MKALYHILTPALVLALLASCNVKMEEPVELPSATDSYTLTVTARIDKAPGTKTSIYYDADAEAYKFSWQPGDQIGLVEYVPNLHESEYWWETLKTTISNPVEGECSNAAFAIELEEREQLNKAKAEGLVSSYQYYVFSPYDEGGDDIVDIREYEESTYIPEIGDYVYEPCVFLRFPDRQQPTGDSFDPLADYLCSDIKSFSKRAVGQLDFNLTRIGSIAKIVCTGLPTNASISFAEIDFGYVCAEKEMFYFPEDGRLESYSDYGVNTLYLMYSQSLYDGDTGEFYVTDPCPVNSDGTFVLWARVAPGETREMNIVLTDSDGVQYSKHITIPEGNPSVVFENGGITTFSTAPLAIDAPTLDFGDIQGYNAMILGNSITLSWQMHPNADHYECRAGDYYNKETIVPVSPVYNGGTVSVTLTPVNPVSTYYGCRWVLYVKTIAKEGHFAKDEELEYLITVSKSGDNIYYKLTPYTFSSDTYSSSGSFNYYSTDYAYSGICQSVFLDGDYEKECLATNPDGVNGESWSFTNTTPLTGIKEFMIQFTSREERDNAIGKIILLGKSAGDSEYRQLTLKTFSSAYLDCDSMKNIDYIKVISAPTPEGSEHPYYSLSIAAFDVSDLIVP